MLRNPICHTCEFFVQKNNLVSCKKKKLLPIVAGSATVILIDDTYYFPRKGVYFPTYCNFHKPVVSDSQKDLSSKNEPVMPQKQPDLFSGELTEIKVEKKKTRGRKKKPE